MLDPVTTTWVMTMLLPGVIGKCTDVVVNHGMAEWKKHSAVGNAIDELKKRLPSHQDEIADALSDWACSNSFCDGVKNHGANWKLPDAVESFKQNSKLSFGLPADYTLEQLVGNFFFELGIQLEAIDQTLRLREERDRWKALLDRMGNIEAVGSKLEQRMLAQEEALSRIADNPLITLSQEKHDSDERLPEERGYHSDIDAAASHLNRGKVKKALEELLHVRREVGKSKQSSDGLQSRLCAYIGDCYARMEQFSGACDEFQKALNYKISRSNYSNLSLAKLNLDQVTEAISLSRKAIAMDKMNGRTAAILVHALSLGGLESECQDFMEDNQTLFDSNPDCLMTAGQIEYDKKNYEGAKDFFEKARKKAPYSPYPALASANCSLKMVDEPVQDCTPLDGLLTVEQKARLSEVQALVKEVLDLSEKDDFDNVRLRALEYRVCAHYLSMSYEDAESDCKAILELSPKNQIAALKLGYLTMIQGQNSAEAIKYFEMVEPGNLAPAAVVSAGAYIDVGDLEKAEQQLAIFEKNMDQKKLWYVFAHEYIRLAKLKSNETEALAYLLEKYSDNGDVLFAVAEYYQEKNDAVNALIALKNAVSCKKLTLQNYIYRLKARIYTQERLWNEAANAFELMPNLREFQYDWHNYITTLANFPNNKMLASAGVEAKQARLKNNGNVIPVITAIEACAKLAKTNEPEEALDLLLRLKADGDQSSLTNDLLREANRQLGRDADCLVALK
ncbi:hypothetical protein KF728_21370 [Candidatus Obscuribacterales bacterium]|nr:hypothetical protein [Candidatus Obscuribacterales bacterium]